MPALSDIYKQRKSLLNHNQELRKDPRALRRLETMCLELKIPETDLPVLKQIYPNLAASDGHIRTAAWNHFINSSVADPYRVRPRRSKAKMT